MYNKFTTYKTLNQNITYIADIQNTYMDIGNKIHGSFYMDKLVCYLLKLLLRKRKSEYLKVLKDL